MYDAKYLVNIKSCACVLLHSYQVCDFNPTEEKYVLGRIGLYFGGFGEKLD